MKRIFAFFAALILCVGLCGSVSAADAEGSEEPIYVYVDFFDDTSNSFLLSNTKIALNSGDKISDLLSALKAAEYLTDYRCRDGALCEADFGEKAVAADGVNSFYIKYNGGTAYDFDYASKLRNGDIIEWIYGELTEPKPFIRPEETPEKPQNSQLSTVQTEAALKKAVNYLELNREKSGAYITAMQIYGKAPDTKLINRILTKIRNRETYNSVALLSRDIVALTMSGYDSSKLSSALSSYENIGSDGTIEYILALIAFNSGNYTAPSDAVNTPQNLKSRLLKRQNSDGSFAYSDETNNASVNSDGLADTLDITLMAITALSPYSNEEACAAAISDAYDYIESVTTDFGFYGVGDVTSESISRYLIAVSSADSEVSGDSVNLFVDLLLRYQNTDGGFSRVKDSGQSDIIATEQAIIALCALRNGAYPYISSYSAFKTVSSAYLTAITDGLSSLSAPTTVFAAAAVLITAAVISFSFYLRRKNRK